jgi:hypothetical protein
MHSPLWTRAGELDAAAELLVATSSASLSSHTGQSERSYAGRPRAARTVTIGRRVRIEERTSEGQKSHAGGGALCHATPGHQWA